VREIEEMEVTLSHTSVKIRLSVAPQKSTSTLSLEIRLGCLLGSAPVISEQRRRSRAEGEGHSTDAAE